LHLHLQFALSRTTQAADARSGRFIRKHAARFNSSCKLCAYLDTMFHTTSLHNRSPCIITSARAVSCTAKWSDCTGWIDVLMDVQTISTGLNTACSNATLVMSDFNSNYTRWQPSSQTTHLKLRQFECQLINRLHVSLADLALPGARGMPSFNTRGSTLATFRTA
jgi:hypothetical protein